MIITKAILWGISRRLIIVWVCLSMLSLLLGDRLMRPVLPLVSSVISSIQSDYRPKLEINKSHPDLIHMQATTRHIIPSIAAIGAKLTAGAHISHALVPWVILFSVLIAWPVECFRQRILLLMLGFLLSMLVVALTIPFQLAGSIEMMFQRYAQQYGVNREKPFLLTWMLFLEVGGRWLLPIMLAIGTCLSLQSMKRNPKKSMHQKKRTLARKKRGRV